MRQIKKRNLAKKKSCLLVFLIHSDTRVRNPQIAVIPTSLVSSALAVAVVKTENPTVPCLLVFLSSLCHCWHHGSGSIIHGDIRAAPPTKGWRRADHGSAPVPCARRHMDPSRVHERGQDRGTNPVHVPGVAQGGEVPFCRPRLGVQLGADQDCGHADSNEGARPRLPLDQVCTLQIPLFLVFHLCRFGSTSIAYAYLVQNLYRMSRFGTTCRQAPDLDLVVHMYNDLDLDTIYNLKKVCYALILTCSKLVWTLQKEI